MSSRVVILLPDIHKNAFSVDELLARQDFYCAKLLHINSKEFIKPIVIVSGFNPTKRNYQHIEVEVASPKKVSIVRFAFLSRRILRKRSINVKSYVAGTPFQPFLTALMLQWIYSHAPIHSAIHGEVSALRSGQIQNRIKLIFLKIFVRKMSTLRFVSTAQLDDAKNFLSLDRIKIFVAPVPVMNKDLVKRKKNSRTAAFVGRIQSERGVAEWIEIAQALRDIDLLVIGSGPLLSNMQSRLPLAKYFGALGNTEVQEIWPEIGVLLSTAPYESYGLAMREALLHQVPVVSRRNAGASELHNRFPSLVWLFESKEDAIVSIYEALSSKNLGSDFKSFAMNFSREQKESLTTLARAWNNEL